ncbi:MAG TPA: ArsA-related P-loop ATPase, partial [Dehalococcoidia bacterium]|nr:ArsA-related P-loop ATPase [Dehalococcoidia bacterium]
LELEGRIEGGAWDVVVVDGPVLAACIDLMAALDAAAHWLDRLFAPRQPTVFEPFLRALTAYASNGEDVYESGRDLLQRLARLRDLLTDAEVSSLRLVLPADPSAAAEAQQALAALALFAYPVDAAVVSRLLPAEVTDPFFAGAHSRQDEARRFLAESLAPLPLLSAQLVPAPGAGLEALRGLAAAVYGERDPAAVLYRGPAHVFAQQDGRQVLSLAVPFARREDLSLEDTDDGLVVRLGGRRRVIPLPRQAEPLAARSSSFDGQTLKVVFG